jgi:hypothetical protein
LLTRFLPLCSIKDTFPSDLNSEEILERAVLDTFDMFSPEHDHPQRIKTVAKMFEKYNADVSFAGKVKLTDSIDAAVVRGVRLS